MRQRPLSAARGICLALLICTPFWLVVLAGCSMDFGLDRLAGLPTAPYDKGPTLSGDKTPVKMIDPAEIDAVCKAMNAALPQGLQAPTLPRGQVYRECYDPWNDVGYVPLYPSKREQGRLNDHMLGHARGGTHDTGSGTGEWREASWARFWRKAAIADAAGLPMKTDAGQGAQTIGASGLPQKRP